MSGPEGGDRPLRLALVWHMHQPDYRDAATGRPTMPWVRLHCTRAYFDMAWMLARHPEIKGVFNFVPVLLEQLESLIEGGEADLYWHLTRTPADQLSEAQREFLLSHFFSVSWEMEVRTRPRYSELLDRRGTHPPFSAVNEFVDQDFRDLQVLFNLAWCGYAAFEEEPVLAALNAKGRGYTEDDKVALLDAQSRILARTLPLYRDLIAKGQVEATTTPYFHPILPLLIDSDFAHRSAPDMLLPARFNWPADAEAHVARAVARHEKHFGVPPTGMWPAEGSVCPEMVPLLARHGIRWMATDEAQLQAALGGRLDDRRDVYRPWRIEIDGDTVVTVFRDRTLSDLLGFTYARNPVDVAVNDLMGRLGHLHQMTSGLDEPPVVSVILDGENPWEHYPQSGKLFLDGLYTALAEAPWVQTTTLAEHLTHHTPKRALGTLGTGSWIGGNFRIWADGDMEREGWRLLGEARAWMEARRDHVGADVWAQATHHLMVAEGSDWFWWYGDDFTTENDSHFDALFRGHLRQVYRLLGGEPPEPLCRSLYPERGHSAVTPPQAFVTPHFDRPGTYFDWIGAGEYEVGGPTASMHRATHAFARMLFGFDLEHLYLRLDPPEEAEGPFTIEAQLWGPRKATARVVASEPQQASLTVDGGSPEPLSLVRVDQGTIQLGVPFEALGAHPGDVVQVQIRVMQGQVEVERYPAAAPLQVQTPDAHFEDLNWTI
ncbi:MAG: glycoside hydrolase [Bradymonadia bacterium]